MALDPQAKALLDQQAAAGVQPSHKLSIEEARQASRRRVALATGTPEPVDQIEDRLIPGPAGEIPVRIYRTRTSGPLPVFVYAHGGGWVLGDLETQDAFCRRIANHVPALVISVDYRLAPEHKFPAAADDAYAATAWAAERARELGGDPARLAVGGGSAGGNLAAVVCLMAKDRGGPPILHQTLFYPVTDYNFQTASYRQNAEGYSLHRADMEWYWRHYLRTPLDGQSPYASPMKAESLMGLPPALVITAEYDPLRDDGEAYARRLESNGVRTVYTCYPGMIHGFVGNFSMFDQGRIAVDQICEELRKAFGLPVSAGAAVS